MIEVLVVEGVIDMDVVESGTRNAQEDTVGCEKDVRRLRMSRIDTPYLPEVCSDVARRRACNAKIFP